MVRIDYPLLAFFSLFSAFFSFAVFSGAFFSLFFASCDFAMVIRFRSLFNISQLIPGLRWSEINENNVTDDW